MKMGVYIEFFTVGNSVKVSAIKTRTGREVSTVGPKTTTRNDRSKLAAQKLKYVINKEKE